MVGQAVELMPLVAHARLHIDREGLVTAGDPPPALETSTGTQRVLLNCVIVVGTAEGGAAAGSSPRVPRRRVDQA